MAKKNTDWLDTEYMVHLLEKSIDPDSVVEHNVQLPDRTSTTGKTRQCDIIIRTGKKGRETITIVEVQHRSRKVELNTFQGWITKMRDVGAQHLICVSTTGFSDTIKEKAKQSGNTIRLITLKKQNIEVLPLNIFSFQLEFNNIDYEFLGAASIHFIKGPENVGALSFTQYDKVIKIEGETPLLSLHELVIECINSNQLFTEQEFAFEFPTSSRSLGVIINNDIFPATIIGRFITKPRLIKGNVKLYSYEQEEDGPLAWAFEGELTIGRTKITAKLPTTLNPDGTFQVRNIHLEIIQDKL